MSWMQCFLIFLLLALTTAYVPLMQVRSVSRLHSAPCTAHGQVAEAQRRASRAQCAATTEKAPLSTAFKQIEHALEALTGDPQSLLEAVVGLPGVATYDRDAIIEYFQQRPVLMLSRAIDFLLAFRRVRAAWDDPGDGVDRGAVLRRELAALGPIAVKLGQTLSQRPDILPEDVCEALQTLQTSNTPFPNKEAYQVIAEEFGAAGPIAPGIPATTGCDPEGPTLFKALTPDCIASASLGQVYRGTLHDGREVAIKVQRPDALRQCLLDGSVLIAVLKAIQGRYWNGDLLAVFDGTAAAIVQELDYRNEARNAKEFRESLSFLGYVDVPRSLPEFTTRRAMAMDWVYGRHLSDLSPEEAMRMTYMSCEAVTAGLILTGLVHADPHEGNIMLTDDGRLVFLDFGFMSRVEDPIMEAFARGIQCVLSKDYVGLVRSFIDTGFVGSPIEWRAKESDPWQLTHPDGDTTAVMAKELRDRMEACEGGGSRFGALSVVLTDMGYFWQMYTPPYIIMLIRTFLTLEGIAGKVDPNFNIYEVALPWAVRRALSPSTVSGIHTLRQSLLTEENKIAWQRIEMLVEEQQVQEREAKEQRQLSAKGAKPQGAGESVREASSSRARLMSQEATKVDLDAALAAAGAEAQAAQAATPLESLTTVLGSSSGKALRRIACDLDSTELMLRLASPSARPVRRMAVQKLAEMLEQAVKRRAKAATHKLGFASGVNAAAITPQPWPSSEAAIALEKHNAERAHKAGRLLLRRHVTKQFLAGWRGAAAFASLAYVLLRVGVAASVRTLIRLFGIAMGKILPARLVAAAAAAAAFVATSIGREVSALGASLTNLADELSIVGAGGHQTGGETESKKDDGGIAPTVA